MEPLAQRPALDVRYHGGRARSCKPHLLQQDIEPRITAKRILRWQQFHPNQERVTLFIGSFETMAVAPRRWAARSVPTIAAEVRIQVC